MKLIPYTGYTNLEGVISTLRDTDLISWLENNSNLADTIFKELSIINDYYEKYDYQNSVKFMKDKTFNSLKELNLSNEEISRIFLEENTL